MTRSFLIGFGKVFKVLGKCLSLAVADQHLVLTWTITQRTLRLAE